MAGALRTLVRWGKSGLLAGVFLLIAPLAIAADCAELLGRRLAWAPSTARRAAQLAVAGSLAVVIAFAAVVAYAVQS
eukprot:7011573-Alexandrium_andersonii.AAC.1